MIAAVTGTQSLRGPAAAGKRMEKRLPAAHEYLKQAELPLLFRDQLPSQEEQPELKKKNNPKSHSVRNLECDWLFFVVVVLHNPASDVTAAAPLP